MLNLQFAETMELTEVELGRFTEEISLWLVWVKILVVVVVLCLPGR